MRLFALTFLCVAASASAQGTKTPAPAANPPAKQATKTPATTTQAKQDTKAAAAGVATQQDAKVGTSATKQGTKVPAPGQRATGITIAPEAAPKPLPVIMRETYDYDAAGRRDPFFSLLASSELRPAIADLKLTSVLYHPTRPIAVMRDATTNTRYTVTLGTTLGRMRVVMIRPRVVIFSIEEFGLNRQDSLVLVDSSKARAK